MRDDASEPGPDSPEHVRETRRIRETTPDGPRIPQSPTATGDRESGTGDYGVELGAGGHRGFGPDDDDATGVRSDEAVRDEIREQLEAAGIEPSAVEIRIGDGKATLEGAVVNLGQKQVAEEIVRRLPGVNDVDNQLRVRGSS